MACYHDFTAEQAFRLIKIYAESDVPVDGLPYTDVLQDLLAVMLDGPARDRFHAAGGEPAMLKEAYETMLALRKAGILPCRLRPR